MIKSAENNQVSVEEVINILLSILFDDADCPEEWNLLKELGENLPIITEMISPMKNGNRNNSFNVSCTCLWAVGVAYSGCPDQAKRELEDLMVYKSQGPLVQGALFQVNSILDPDNDKYDLKDKFCPIPFTQIQILEKSCHLCCASWLPVFSGDMNSNDWFRVWNSENS